MDGIRRNWVFHMGGRPRKASRIERESQASEMNPCSLCDPDGGRYKGKRTDVLW